ncbi:hypothetical protein [Streptomyces hydrogenans]
MSTLTRTARGRAAAPSVQRLRKSDADILGEVLALSADGARANTGALQALTAELASRYTSAPRPDHGDDPLGVFALAVHSGPGGTLVDQGHTLANRAWAARCRHNATAGEFRVSYEAAGLDPEMAPAPYGAGTLDREAELTALGIRSFRDLYRLTSHPVAPVLAAFATGDREELRAACDDFLAATGSDVTVAAP